MKTHTLSPVAASEEPPAKKVKTSAISNPFAHSSAFATDTKVLNRLDINARVYFCADLLGVKNLKVLAAERFMADARKTFSDNAFAVGKLLSTTLRF